MVKQLLTDTPNLCKRRWNESMEANSPRSTNFWIFGKHAGAVLIKEFFSRSKAARTSISSQRGGWSSKGVLTFKSTMTTRWRSLKSLSRYNGTHQYYGKHEHRPWEAETEESKGTCERGEKAWEMIVNSTVPDRESEPRVESFRAPVSVKNSAFRTGRGQKTVLRAPVVRKRGLLPHWFQTTYSNPRTGPRP